MCTPAYRENNKEKLRVQKAAYRASHKEDSAAYRAAHKEDSAAYRAIHKEERTTYHTAHKDDDNARSAAYRAAHKGAAYPSKHYIYVSVRDHHRWIFKSTEPKHHNYKIYPFFDAWNPDKGGSFQAGADWIEENIGKRPDGYSLHVLQTGLGFVPGNLVWADRKRQATEKTYKVLPIYIARNRVLEDRVEALEDRVRVLEEMFAPQLALHQLFIAAEKSA